MLKGGIEKHGSGVVGWLLPQQLLGQGWDGDVVARIAPIPTFPRKPLIVRAD